MEEKKIWKLTEEESKFWEENLDALELAFKKIGDNISELRSEVADLKKNKGISVV